MRLPNQFLIYVSDTASSAAFYGELFGMQAQMLSHRYAIFDLGGGVVLALWGGKTRTADAPSVPAFEVGLLVEGGSPKIREIYDEWLDKGVEILEEPCEDVFGLTFVAADLDGNRLRVAPVDR
ncbi:VOC family protein [Rhodococcus sp. TAF43]|uniref:VOC family protein n=1 Tax=unclassified Rhodococcus (in: high G+C Gram-positive bacteria) TaxID=192944 RepID=UPI000E0B79D5|nr:MULTISPECIES: VOC family protein [unclassified Rhodococcus (in: high G+C Gram-positive bacteria)]QKT09620.1 VOC family protein [Rhodococcus sp. W8901]RDI16881.1 catechol 2,3-dioxygenase-like lactoylglutathione lyase family enzyme [Rhodococcus sp. AG1013]